MITKATKPWRYRLPAIQQIKQIKQQPTGNTPGRLLNYLCPGNELANETVGRFMHFLVYIQKLQCGSASTIFKGFLLKKQIIDWHLGNPLEKKWFTVKL